MRCIYDNWSLVIVMSSVWSGDVGEVFLVSLGSAALDHGKFPR